MIESNLSVINSDLLTRLLQQEVTTVVVISPIILKIFLTSFEKTETV